MKTISVLLLLLVAGNVVAQTVTFVAIRPIIPIIQPNQSLPLTASAEYGATGANDITNTATWSSSNPRIVTVTPNGTITGHAVGAATVYASFSGIRGQTQVLVVLQAGPKAPTPDEIKALTTP